MAIRTLAQTGAVAAGSKVYVAPMDGNLHTFIAAEIMKQKLPLIVVTDEAAADYTLSGQAQVSGGTEKGNGSILAPLRGHQQYGGAVTLASNPMHSIVWGSDRDNAGQTGCRAGRAANVSRPLSEEIT